VAERQLPKLNVAGSIPVSRSSTPKPNNYNGFSHPAHAGESGVMTSTWRKEERRDESLQSAGRGTDGSADESH
jgi:hypothetical protein